jgi:predicted  nucleic acid-binding Zn-ribbon protein
MGEQLECLIKIQDLVNRRYEMENDTTVEQFQEMGFKIDRKRELKVLSETIEDLVGKLNQSTQDLYKRVSLKYTRPLAPVINGICYGCFVALPTAQDTGKKDGKTVETCSSCGRIIYWI